MDETLETKADMLDPLPPADGTEFGSTPDEEGVETSTTSDPGATSTSKSTSGEGDIRDDPRFKRRLETPNYSPVQVLLTKLEAWLLQQPEWAYILAAPRKTRREAITLISKRLLTIPNRYQRFGG